MYQPWSSTTAKPPAPIHRPVWVDPEAFYGPSGPGIPGADGLVPGGLIVATGRAPGLLGRRTRSTDSRWFDSGDSVITDKYGAQVRSRRPAKWLGLESPASAA